MAVNVLHWKQENPPHAAAWKALVDAVAFGGLVHAMVALPHLQGNYGPADVADLVSDMCSIGVLEAVGLDMAGAGASVRAFRGLGPSAGGNPSPVWNRGDAHLWTYREGPALRPEPKKPSAGEQLALLDWKGNIEREHPLATEGTGHGDLLRRDGQGELRPGAAARNDPREEQSRLGEEVARVGQGPAEGPQASRPVPGALGDRTEALRRGESGLGGREEAPRRDAEGEVLGRAEAEADPQAEELARAGVLTLGGLRPGSRYVVLPGRLPGRNQLWWKPCLTRDPDTGREHCWFLSPTNFPSLFCKACHPKRAFVQQPIARAA